MPWYWPFKKKKPYTKPEISFADNLYLGILQQLAVAPDSQISERLRKKCIILLETSPSEAECYDLLDRISKEPCFKVSDKVCLGEISSFTQKLCDVTAYYPHPDASNTGNSSNGRE